MSILKKIELDPTLSADAAEVQAIQAVARALRNIRKERGLTQKQIAAKMGVSQARVSQVESGKVESAPSYGFIARYAHACEAAMKISTEFEFKDRGLNYGTIAEAASLIQKGMAISTRGHLSAEAHGIVQPPNIGLVVYECGVHLDPLESLSEYQDQSSTGIRKPLKFQRHNKSGKIMVGKNKGNPKWLKPTVKLKGSNLKSTNPSRMRPKWNIFKKT
jgi:transcriptional regulator with XRE-family HTH domain